MSRVLVVTLATLTAVSSHRLSMSVNDQSGIYSLSVDDTPWYSSPGAPTICLEGKPTVLSFHGTSEVSGDDKFGHWKGVAASYAALEAEMVLTFKSYGTSKSDLIVATASFPKALNTSGCGPNTHLSTRCSSPPPDAPPVH